VRDRCWERKGGRDTNRERLQKDREKETGKGLQVGAFGLFA